MLAAVVGAPILVVLTVNMSIRPMIVTSGGLLLQHLLIGTVRNRAIDLRKACCGNFSDLRRAQFSHRLYGRPHSASAHNVWGLARTSAAEQSRSTTGISSQQVSALILAATFGSMLTPYGPKLDMYSASLASSKL
jgi:hypothetical protein